MDQFYAVTRECWRKMGNLTSFCDFPKRKKEESSEGGNSTLKIPLEIALSPSTLQVKFHASDPPSV